MITFRELLTEQVLRMGKPSSRRQVDEIHEINNLAHRLTLNAYFRDQAKRKARAHKQAERRALCLA